LQGLVEYIFKIFTLDVPLFYVVLQSSTKLPPTQIFIGVPVYQ